MPPSTDNIRDRKKGKCACIISPASEIAEDFILFFGVGNKGASAGEFGEVLH